MLKVGLGYAAILALFVWLNMRFWRWINTVPSVRPRPPIAPLDYYDVPDPDPSQLND
jgi:hypothetical protein